MPASPAKRAPPTGAPARRSLAGRQQLPAAPAAPAAAAASAVAGDAAPDTTSYEGRRLRKSAAAPPPGRGSPARGGFGRLRAGSPAPVPAAAAGTAATPSAARHEIDALMAKHNPAKLASVDQLVEQYGEQEFLKIVRAKYLGGDPQLTPPSPKSPTPMSRGRGRLRSPVGSTAGPPAGTGRSLSRGRGRASSPTVAAAAAAAAAPHPPDPPVSARVPPDPSVVARVACEAGDWDGLVRTVRARPELVVTLGLVDLAQRHRGPSRVISELCEMAGLPVLAPRPLFVAQRLPQGVLTPVPPPVSAGQRSSDSEEQKLQVAPTEPDGRRPSPTVEENLSETFFAVVAPVEIVAERSFDLRVRAYIATQLHQVSMCCFVHTPVSQVP
jgi:hypothetical protein